MPQVQSLADLASLKTPEEFMRFGTIALQSIFGVVNGGLEFDKNLLSQTVNVKFDLANTNTAVAHNLKKTGVNFIVVSKDAACDVYRGTGDTIAEISLKGTVATSVTVVLF